MLDINDMAVMIPLAHFGKIRYEFLFTYSKQYLISPKFDRRVCLATIDKLIDSGYVTRNTGMHCSLTDKGLEELQKTSKLLSVIVLAIQRGFHG